MPGGFLWYGEALCEDGAHTRRAGNTKEYELKNFKVMAVLTFKRDSFFVWVVGRTQE